MIATLVLYFVLFANKEVTGTGSMKRLLNSLRNLEKLSDETRFEKPKEYTTENEVNRILWLKYYECLTAQYETMGRHRMVPPKAVASLEGDNVLLECRLCLSPRQHSSKGNWFWHGREVPDEPNIRLEENGSLHLFGVADEQAGHYECRVGDARSRPYFLFVITEDDPLVAVKGPYATNGPFAGPDKRVSIGVTLTTSWAPWSECSRCGAVGKRYKFGACFVTVYSEKDLTEDIVKEPTLLDEKEGFSFLEIFPQGLPCRSHLIKEKLKKFADIEKRPNEIMVAFCKPDCVDNIFEVRNTLGNIIERVNNTAGVFSALQGAPPMPPLFTRITIYAAIAQPLVLICPGNINRNIPYRWAINKTVRLLPWIEKKETGGRVTVNERQRLIFKEVEPSDGRIYTCWQGDAVAGIIRVIVFEAKTLKFSHHILLLGVIVILGTFVYLFTRVYLNRMRAASM